MKKQRKLLTDEEKEKICKSRRGVCASPDGRDWCPLFLGIPTNIFCYRNIDRLEQTIQNMHNEEVEFNARDNEV